MREKEIGHLISPVMVSSITLGLFIPHHFGSSDWHCLLSPHSALPHMVDPSPFQTTQLDISA